MRQLVPDQGVQFVRRAVDRQNHPVLDRVGEGGDELGDEPEADVGLLELDMRLVVDDGDADTNLVLEDLGDPQVLALQVGDHLLEQDRFLDVIVNVEVRRLVDVPVDTLVVNLVLAEAPGRGGDQQCDHHQDEGRPKKRFQTGPPARAGRLPPARTNR